MLFRIVVLVFAAFKATPLSEGETRKSPFWATPLAAIHGPAPYASMTEGTGKGGNPHVGKGSLPIASGGDLRASLSHMSRVRQVTSSDVYSAGQKLWFASQKRQHPPTPSLSSAVSAVATPQGEEDTPMEDDAAQASEPQQGLINPVPLDEDAAYAIAASQAGVDMNNLQAVEQWMAEPIANRGDVLRTIRHYHIGVIRTELYNVVGQVEHAFANVNDRLLRTQRGLEWLQSDNRQLQKQAAGLQVLLTGWDPTLEPENRLYMVDWMLRQVGANRVFMTQRGQSAEDDDQSPYKFLQILQADPSTPPAGTGRWSTITALNFKAWDLRKAFVDAFAGSTGTPLYRDNGTPIPNHHVRVVPATPQFQRKLELPLRVLLHVINNSEVFRGQAGSHLVAYPYHHVSAEGSSF